MKKLIFSFFENNLDRSRNKFFSLKRFAQKFFSKTFLSCKIIVSFIMYEGNASVATKKNEKKKTKNFSK